MSETNLALTEVEKLVADETTVICRGETFKLKAFGIRKLQRAMPHIAVIHSLLQLINDQAEDDMDGCSRSLPTAATPCWN